MMPKKTFLFPILVLSAIILISHTFASYFYLYWMTPWIDTPTHFLGGSIVSLIFWSLVFRINPGFILENPRFFTLLIGIVVGILWEVFELHFSITSLVSSGYLADTLWDILNSVIGVFISFYYFVKPVFDSEENKI